MNLSDCAKFANENPVTYIATMDGDQPRVRAFLMWFADETGFYYHTGMQKSVCQQLLKNPKVELCFYAPAEDGGPMMRVAGEVEFLDDAALRERLVRERPWLLQIVSGADDPGLAVFRVAHGEAYLWTMEYNMREAEAPRVRF